MPETHRGGPNMNAANSNKTVAIVEWNWTGHHPGFFNNFILALEEGGFDVLAICPNPAEAAELANRTRRDSGAGMSGRGHTQYLEIAISSAAFRAGRSGGFRTVYWTIHFFRNIEQQVRAWSKLSKTKVNSVFYCCIYDWEFQWAHVAQPFLHLPWTGMYVHARSYRMPGSVNPVTGKVPRPEIMFRGRLCKSIAMLDEGKCQEMSKSIGKPVVVLPEVTDERQEVNLDGRRLGDQMESFAAGRPLVGLFGHLGLSKGILTFLEGAKKSNPSEICFALVGEIGWSKEDDERISSIREHCPNLWCHLRRIPDEALLNHLMSKCQVIFAAYLDFPHSSGMTSKAVLLEKPLVVSDGYLMAERTRRFNLGEIIPQGDVDAFLAAVARITNNPAAWIAGHQPRWADYRQENSFERLKQKMKELIRHTE